MRNELLLTKENHSSLLGSYISMLDINDLKELISLKEQANHASSHLGLNAQVNIGAMMRDQEAAIINKQPEHVLEWTLKTVQQTVTIKTKAAKEALMILDSHEDSGGNYDKIITKVAKANNISVEQLNEDLELFI
jgi:hypothetical protein